MSGLTPKATEEGKNLSPTLRVVRHVDESVWREFVQSNPRANIFHTPEMFQVFARARGCRPTLWATVDAENRILALFLPVEMTVLNGLLRAFTTRAVVFGGALAVPGEEGQRALALLLQAYNRAVRRSVLFTELRNVFDPSGLQPVLSDSGFASEGHLNFLIDVSRPEAELWQQINSGARRNIQKAAKSGVVVEELCDPKDIPAAYAVLRNVYKRIQVPLPDLSLFQAAFDILRPAGMVRILAARQNGTTLGVLFLLVHKGIATYWYTGCLREHSALRPADLLVWSALQSCKQLNCHTYDFGGAGRLDEEYGVRDFKAKYGGQLVNFGRHVCTHAPWRFKLTRRGYQLVRRFL